MPLPFNPTAPRQSRSPELSYVPPLPEDSGTDHVGGSVKLPFSSTAPRQTRSPEFGYIPPVPPFCNIFVESGVVEMLDGVGTLFGEVHSGRGDPYSLQWSMVSGPGTVVFSDPTSVETDFTVDTEGDYVFRLTASDMLCADVHDDTSGGVVLFNFLIDGNGEYIVDYNGDNFIGKLVV